MSSFAAVDLSDSPECKAVLDHPIFSRIKDQGVNRDGAQRLVGQFWHPSHYFPTFLARLISVCPSLDVMTSLSRILWQELGEGDPSRAHEAIYVDTLLSVGLADPSDPEDPPMEGTGALVSLYKKGSRDYLSGLGCIYATEAIDLPIVTGLGAAITSATGVADLAWVDIHAKQEPDHMESAATAIAADLREGDGQRIANAARSMWLGWHDFYCALEMKLFGAASTTFGLLEPLSVADNEI